MNIRNALQDVKSFPPLILTLNYQLMPRYIFGVLGCIMAQTAGHWPLTAKARARSQFRLVKLAFLVDKMALGHVFPQALLFFLVNVIPAKARMLEPFVYLRCNFGI